MHAFYTLATEDYRQLAAARNWAVDLRDHTLDGRIRLLDVACGSGWFPRALLAAGLPARPSVAVDLLDPSGFSIAEARGVLRTPFSAAAQHEMGIQDFHAPGAYDVVWATHAFYALPPEDLGRGVARMVAALRPGGFGAVAQASSSSHYLRFYEAYRATFAPWVTPYSDAEGVAEALRAEGARIDVQALHYTTQSADRAVIEGFLQRCVLDSTVSLARMETEGRTAEFLAGCRAADGSYTFTHEAHLMTWDGR